MTIICKCRDMTTHPTGLCDLCAYEVYFVEQREKELDMSINNIERIAIEDIKKGDRIRFEYDPNDSDAPGRIYAGEYFAARDGDTSGTWITKAKYYLLERPIIPDDVVMISKESFDNLTTAWVDFFPNEKTIQESHLSIAKALDWAINDVYQSYKTLQPKDKEYDWEPVLP